MKNTFVAVLWLMLGAAAYGDNYNWNYIDLGVNDNGDQTGPMFTLSSELGESVFIRSNIMRLDYDDADAESLFSFYTAGYRGSVLYAELGLARMDICQQICEDDYGTMAMLGVSVGDNKLNAKVGIGAMDLLNKTWRIFEADASYAISDNIGLYIGIMQLEDIVDSTTRLGVRFSW